MELPVFFQAGQFLQAALLGAGLCLWYDLLRAVRRAIPASTPLADGAFLLTVLPSLLAFALYPGRGQFRLFFFPAIALGAAAGTM